MVVKATPSQFLGLSRIPLSSHTKNFKSAIHRSLAWHLGTELMWRVKCEILKSLLNHDKQVVAFENASKKLSDSYSCVLYSRF